MTRAAESKKGARVQAARRDSRPPETPPPRKVTVVDRNAWGIGMSFRKPTPGPEGDLVRWFMHDWKVEVLRGCDMTVFVEPRLESGFPDMVLVQWRKDWTRHWRPERRRLKNEDIRVLHSLWYAGPASERVLKNAFGSGVTAKLGRLRDANVVSRRSGSWRARPLRKIFAVRRIIAIEAKMGDIQRGLQQALLNTWFASASYLLMPHVPRADKIAGRATSLGVGLWSQKAGIVRQAAQARVPRSYASWLFNEWAWRASHLSQAENNAHRYGMAGGALS